MYCPEKMKLNKFRHVAIPKNSDFFARLAGARPVVPDSMKTGDVILPNGASKVDTLDMISKKELNEIRREAAEERDNMQKESDK